MELAELKNKVNSALDKLYEVDHWLIDKGLCERCINHRFAVHLEQQNFGVGYFVDCEYNKSHLEEVVSPKKVSSINGNYIDIIITKRDGNYINDLACFEVKRWNNTQGRKKDRDNLQILTGGENAANGIGFGYDYGFYIIFGKRRNEVVVEVYRNGAQETEAIWG